MLRPSPSQPGSQKKLAQFMDFIVKYLETTYTEKDKEAATVPDVCEPEWDTLLKMKSIDSDTSESLSSESDESDDSSSSSESEEETGKKCRRQKSKSGRPKKKVVMAKEAGQREAMNTKVRGKRKGSSKKRPDGEDMHDPEESSLSGDVIESAPKLSEYEMTRLANMKAIAEDPCMVEINNVM